MLCTSVRMNVYDIRFTHTHTHTYTHTHTHTHTFTNTNTCTTFGLVKGFESTGQPLQSNVIFDIH